MKSSEKQQGFSLIELMITVAIVGIMASIAVPKFQTFQGKARQAEAKHNLSMIYTMEHSYQAANEVFAPIAAIGINTGCPAAGAASPNLVGFVPQPCATSRYAYSAALTATGFDGTADETAANKIFPGCATVDVWTINENKSVTDTGGALAACS